VVGAQSNEDGVENLASSFYRVQYRSRVVHHTERIYKGSEFPIYKFLADIACETRANEQYTFARHYLETRFRHIDYRSKLHIYKGTAFCSEAQKV